MTPRQDLAPEPVPRRRRRLVYSLLVVLILVGLVPLASFAFKLIDTSRRALMTSQQEIELQLASSIAAQLDMFLDGQARQVGTLADSFAAGIDRQGLHAFEQDIRKRAVLSELVDDPLVALRFAPLTGPIEQALVDANAPPRELEAVFASEFGAIAEDPAGRSARGSQHARVSDPIVIGPSGFTGVVVSAPVASGGVLHGVLQGFVSLEPLWRRAAILPATGHEIYAVDGRGRLFAHTDPAAVAERRNMRQLEIVQKFLVSKSRTKETVAFRAVRNGREEGMLGAYDPTNRGWGVFVQVEESSAYVLIREMVTATVTWSAVALLLAILVGIVFAGTISRPIVALAKASRSFAEGDREARADVRSRNEIGELAESFNAMASEIQDQFLALEAAERETNELFLDTVRALAQAIDAKDPYTKGHSVRVSKYADIVARHMGLTERQMRHVQVASLLHDVGKIGIDDAILKKPAQLTREEFEVMKQHPEKGAKIMGRIHALSEIVPGMRHHHERYGGGGYPLGLKGDEIPLIARIINVADTLDAMTTHRPYQAAFPFEAAVARINELKGSVCDPKVVEAFNRAYHNGEFDLERKTADAPPDVPPEAESNPAPSAAPAPATA